MAKQTINIGAAPNDGTGTPLRTSFDYTNQNFTELYTSLGGGTGLPGAVTQVLFNNGTNVAGDAGMTYNSTTDVLSVGGVTASGNVSVAGTFTARNGDNASSMRASASDYAAVAFDGTTSGTRVTSTLTGQNIGTGDFSVWSRFRVPALATFTSNPATIALGPTNTDGGGNNSCRLVLLSGGSLSFRINDGAGATTSGDIANFSTGYSGQVVDVVVTRTGATLKIYINGSDTAYTGTPAASTSINSIYCQTGIGIGVALFSGRIYRSVVFNRALSASDVTELITTGVNPADQWGTQTQSIGYNPAVLNGGFETNSLNASGTWATAAAVTSTATIDTSGLFSRTGTNAGKLTLDASTSYTAFNANNSAATVFAVSKRYRFSFWVRKGAASGVCGVQYGNASSGALYGTTTGITTTYSNILFETITSVDGGFVIGRAGSSAALSEIYIDDVEVTRIGAIVDLDFTVGTGYQTYDRSTNNLHGTLFGGVEFTMPRRSAVLYATTNTSGNQQMLGTLAIPTNAIIEDIIVNSTGAATVSVGNASAGTQIVNAAAVVSGRQKLTIATPFSTTGNLWVNSSTTATLQFTIAYTIAL
jgi:hypothetical protein